mmetsp:Transcript_7894/g.13880  ORF Transcript_7894/g.13880 Transcript_7894/m.13880 type:complete len:660 (-) Transcript_7894:291-2270(-)|eukprot:CAMPEP_0183743882 /NCGR_PEP_ID=MMETSP0737-20130205/65445_1 /TAXON_ID=385413 /ORGANISM="Thalassiosira miniscula, Strain CCMP1093" /LENGTH=659 /DNA_ID=CAMNT_0025979511 /DNA_START=486 /DNA_END=2465 /DNA_ORIENTATION=-
MTDTNRMVPTVSKPSLSPSSLDPSPKEIYKLLSNYLANLNDVAFFLRHQYWPIKSSGIGNNTAAFDLRSYYARRPGLRKYTLGVELDRMDYQFILRDGTSTKDKDEIRAYFGVGPDGEKLLKSDDDEEVVGDREELLLRAANQSLLADMLVALTVSEEDVVATAKRSSNGIPDGTPFDQSVGLILSGPILGMTSIAESCCFNVDLQWGTVEAVCLLAISVPLHPAAAENVIDEVVANENGRLVLARAEIALCFQPYNDNNEPSVQCAIQSIKPFFTPNSMLIHKFALSLAQIPRQLTTPAAASCKTKRACGFARAGVSISQHSHLRRQQQHKQETLQHWTQQNQQQQQSRRVVHFPPSSSIITSVNTRPKTEFLDVPKLYYTGSDIKRFKREYKESEDAEWVEVVAKHERALMERNLLRRTRLGRLLEGYCGIRGTVEKEIDLFYGNKVSGWPSEEIASGKTDITVARSDENCDGVSLASFAPSLNDNGSLQKMDPVFIESPTESQASPGNTNTDSSETKIFCRLLDGYCGIHDIVERETALLLYRNEVKRWRYGSSVPPPEVFSSKDAVVQVSQKEERCDLTPPLALPISDDDSSEESDHYFVKSTIQTHLLRKIDEISSDVKMFPSVHQAVSILNGPLSESYDESETHHFVDTMYLF